MFLLSKFLFLRNVNYGSWTFPASLPSFLFLYIHIRIVILSFNHSSRLLLSFFFHRHILYFFSNFPHLLGFKFLSFHILSLNAVFYYFFFVMIFLIYILLGFNVFFRFHFKSFILKASVFFILFITTVLIPLPPSPQTSHSVTIKVLI